MEKKTIVKLILIVAVLAVVLTGVLYMNEYRKSAMIEKLSANLMGKSYSNMLYRSEMKLYDPVNQKEYRFYGARSSFVFGTDSTVTWTREFDRSINKGKYTAPISTTVKYEVAYLGDFWFDVSDFCLKLESGDILGFHFFNEKERDNGIPSGVNYSNMFDDFWSAPEALADADTSYISTSGKTTTGKINSQNTASKTCSNCSGTGRVTKSFGKTWSKKPGYGYGDICASCGGTGRK